MAILGLMGSEVNNKNTIFREIIVCVIAHASNQSLTKILDYSHRPIIHKTSKAA